MKKLRLYKIDITYIKYLYKFDKKVQYNEYEDDEYTAKRPYLGIVLNNNNMNYFVPLEHPRVQHSKMKNNSFIFKIHKGKYGILGFNNMIPVKQKELVNFNINDEEKRYKQILISQYRYCNKHIKEITSKAENTYKKRVEGNNKFINEICCDFKLLEDKCNNYK